MCYIIKDMDRNKIIIPGSILLASIILGGFYFFAQINKQNSIERQQYATLEAEKEKQIRDYIAKRKLDCLEIWKEESKKYNNVRDWRYEPVVYDGGVIADNCEITYTNGKGEAFLKTY